MLAGMQATAAITGGELLVDSLPDRRGHGRGDGRGTPPSAPAGSEGSRSAGPRCFWCRVGSRSRSRGVVPTPAGGGRLGAGPLVRSASGSLRGRSRRSAARIGARLSLPWLSALGRPGCLGGRRAAAGGDLGGLGWRSPRRRSGRLRRCVREIGGRHARRAGRCQLARAGGRRHGRRRRPQLKQQGQPLALLFFEPAQAPSSSVLLRASRPLRSRAARRASSIIRRAASRAARVSSEAVSPSVFRRVWDQISVAVGPRRPPSVVAGRPPTRAVGPRLRTGSAGPPHHEPCAHSPSVRCLSGARSSSMVWSKLCTVGRLAGRRAASPR